MPLGVAAHTTEDEAQALEALRQQDEANGDNQPLDGDEGPGPGAEPSGQADQTPANTAESGDTRPADSQPQAAAPADDKSKGDPSRAALRAARAAERRVLAENARLKEELDRLKAGQPQPADNHAADGDDITDDDIQELAADFPKLGKVARVLKKVVGAVPVQQQQQQAQEPEFVPAKLDDVLQDAVDQIPDLSAWHNDPDQTRFAMAASMDGVLMRHPVWSKKPLEERLAEAVRRVNAELGQTEAPTRNTPNGDDVRQAIERAPLRTPRAGSEIGGGSRADSGPDLSRFSHMASEDVEAELATRG